MKFEKAQKIADAVLYEGYLLYPYRASATKNKMRWQFGVVAPRDYSECGGSDPCSMQTECLIETGDAPLLELRLRFLQLQARTVEQAVCGVPGIFLPIDSLTVDGRQLVSWDEGIERELDYPGIDLASLAEAGENIPFDIQGGWDTEIVRNAAGEIHGRIRRERFPIRGVIRVAVEPWGSLLKVCVRIENSTPWPPAGRADRNGALRHSLIGAHTLLAVSGGNFLSLLDPPQWARQAAEKCVNRHTWPVLVGDQGQRDVILSSPIILYDYPQIAPESAGDMFDGTEIDEILALRTMTLTDEEKKEARETDNRAAAIIERTDAMPSELLERLHGAIRYLRTPETTAARAEEAPAWWDPGTDSSVSPETDTVQIGEARVSKGCRVRLAPGARRADAQDIFLQGRVATVEAVYSDVDDKQYLAVTLDDDPAASLHRWHGRYLYFYPDEVEPLTGG